MAKTTKVPTRTIHINTEVHGRFKDFCQRRGIKVGAATEELLECILSGTISGSVLTRDLKEYQQLYGK